MDPALLSGLIAATALLLGVLGTWLATRRTSSGRIGTSTADVLWGQAQAMRAELVAQRDKAIEQRDRLMDAQSAQTGPALVAISEALAAIKASLERNNGGG